MGRLQVDLGSKYDFRSEGRTALLALQGTAFFFCSRRGWKIKTCVGPDTFSPASLLSTYPAMGGHEALQTTVANSAPSTTTTGPGILAVIIIGVVVVVGAFFTICGLWYCRVRWRHSKDTANNQ